MLELGYNIALELSSLGSKKNILVRLVVQNQEQAKLYEKKFRDKMEMAE